MNKTIAIAGLTPAQTGFIKTGFLCLPMAIITLMMLTGGRMPAGGDRLFAFAVAFVFFNAIFFLMIRTGKTDRWRSILFVTYAIMLSTWGELTCWRAKASLTLRK